MMRMETVDNKLAVLAFALFFSYTGLDIALAPPAVAQNKSEAVSNKSRITGSLYTVDGQVTVSGWEHELIRRNHGLSRYNWSPITAARHGVVVFRTQGSSQALKQYHDTKPIVLNTADMQKARKIREARAEVKYSHSMQAGAALRYDSGSTLWRKSNDAGIRSSRSESGYTCDRHHLTSIGNSAAGTSVQGRLISVK